MKFILLSLCVFGAAATSVEMEAQQNAEDLTAMWLDYKAAEHMLQGQEGDYGSEMLDHVQKERAEASGSTVLRAVYNGLERLKEDVPGTKKQPMALIEVNALGELSSDDMVLEASAMKAVEMLLQASARVEKTAEASASHFNEAFLQSESAELRAAIGELEGAFQHLTGQNLPIEHSAEVQEMFQAAGKSVGRAEGFIQAEDVRTIVNRADGVDEETADWAVQRMMDEQDFDKDGKISWAEAERYVKHDDKQKKRDSVIRMVKTAASGEKRVSPSDEQIMTFPQLAKSLDALDAASLIQMEEKAQAQTEAQSQAEMEYQSYKMQMEAESAQVKNQAEVSMMKLQVEFEQEEAERKKQRELRWRKVAQRQKASLAQKEKEMQEQQKEVERLEREEKWEKEETKKTSALKAEEAKQKACQGDRAAVRAVLVVGEGGTGHADCLSSQLGECTQIERVLATKSQSCNDPGPWQKRCLAGAEKDLRNCAPQGADWSALRNGASGVEADNAALKQLSEWCTFYEQLEKVEDGQDKSPYALLLSHDAAADKELVAKVTDLAKKNGAGWKFARIDGSRNIVVRSDAAVDLRRKMAGMQAIPLPKLLGDITDIKSWSPGASAVLTSTHLKAANFKQDPLLCSTSSPGKATTPLKLR